MAAASPLFPPYLCTAGYFKDKWIQAEIAEVQKGDRARKMGEGKDARGLDPPPVARVKVFQCEQDGTGQRELDPSDIVAHVLLTCSVTLYPYNFQYESDPSAFPDGCPAPSPILPEGSSHPVLAVEKRYPTTLPARPLRPLEPSAALANHTSGCRQFPIIVGSRWAAARLCPQAFGDDRSKGALYCIFDDIKIRRTGHFALKYNVFLVDTAFIDSQRGTMPLLAECWGGVFAVYPSKAVPPLHKATLLTQHLARCGLLTRARNAERQPRRRTHDEVDPGPDDAGSSDEEFATRTPDGLPFANTIWITDAGVIALDVVYPGAGSAVVVD
ncbi:hypothetical protein AURDEDRAFT_172008 [Auricularia subglabra TFB-10046 SS5]|nr:hypothetical protein AURDEDRAFT_172008 [Auricularia subglabra TFB-10046 SS5]